VDGRAASPSPALDTGNAPSAGNPKHEARNAKQTTAHAKLPRAQRGYVERQAAGDDNPFCGSGFYVAHVNVKAFFLQLACVLLLGILMSVGPVSFQVQGLPESNFYPCPVFRGCTTCCIRPGA